ncbi:CHASE4 domain-containing protein [Paenibacillus hexagrammi]|uniref:Diguanylate cyclase n=1 Tax=Paenibacillus hexagrammi TaxID=2908839 RepID=A0ABY3SLS7_9BACL|nr:CHASE4 domain-containing protein [Paenibacillus sp. YPD9-1]UJF34802.1 diguanylate cyclase [Paenibacillus sp. YPD9-1]
MSLRHKIIFFIVLSSILLMSVIAVLAEKIVMQNYLELEKRDTLLYTNRVINLINEDINKLYSINISWSCWDDSYEFMGKNGESSSDDPYLERNYSSDDFSTNGFEYAIYLNNDHKVVLALEYNKTTGTVDVLNDKLYAYIQSHAAQLQAKQDPKIITGGIVHVDEQNILLNSSPILKSDFTGDMRGTLILGRALDEDYTQSISDRMLISVELEPVDQAPLQGSLPVAKLPEHQILPHSEIWTVPQDSNTITGYSQMYDLEGKAAFTLSISQQRDIYRQGLQNFRLLVISLFLSAIMFSLIVLIFLNRSVLRRLATLTASVDRITESKDITARFQITGNDEISSLKKSFNNMMGELENYQRMLQHRANHDTLTDLPNRQYLRERFEQEMQTARESGCKLTVVYVDLNNFKEINDHYGHEAGDRLLVHIANSSAKQYF